MIRHGTNRPIFCEELYDNQGKLRCGTNQVIDDKELLRNVDWLVKGAEVVEKVCDTNRVLNRFAVAEERFRQELARHSVDAGKGRFGRDGRHRLPGRRGCTRRAC